jgi:hypothetical protein
LRSICCRKLLFHSALEGKRVECEEDYVWHILRDAKGKKRRKVLIREIENGSGKERSLSECSVSTSESLCPA